MIYVTIDIETSGLNRYKDEITWVGIGLARSLEDENFFKEYYLDMSNPDDVAKLKNVLSKLLEKEVRFCFQNGKFDTLFIKHHHSIILPIHYDTMLLGTIYDLAGEHGLKPMAIHYLKVEPWDISKKEKTSRDPEKVLPYLKLDVRYTWWLVRYFNERMTKSHWKQYKKLLLPAYLMYRHVETVGLPLDQTLLKEAKIRYAKDEKRKLLGLKKHYDINWNSAKQLSDVLYNKEGLPVLKRSEKTGEASADAKTLRRLAAKGFELPSVILDYKSTNTIIKMFLNRWEEDSSYDGRIHSSFGLTNVRTGRTSCSDPNLQQVPRLPDIRSMFRSTDKGRELFEADYSQLELRIAAHYAKEPTMLKIYENHGDIHTETALTLIGGREMTKADRGSAKAVNFGFVYGMGAKGFVNYAFDSYGVVFTLAEAQHYREMFFMKYSRLLGWHEEMAQLCEAMGGVENLFGRFRALPLIFSNNKGEYNSAVRRAINTPVQSSGSDLLLSAATQINKELKKEGVRICCTVHDSIVGEFNKGDEDWLLPEIKRIMCHPKVLDDFEVELRVALEIDIGIGPWGTH